MAAQLAPEEMIRFKRHEHIARVGEPQRQIYRLEEGWACRFRALRDGRRQIVGLFLPGELCEPHWVLSPRADFPVVALTALRATAIGMDDLAMSREPDGEGLGAVYGAMVRAINWQADWMVSLGRRNATERICAFVCDIVERMRSNGRMIGDSLPMPLTQNDVADIVGLTPIHVNRVFKALREEGLIELKKKWLRVADLAALQRLAAD